MFQRLDESSGKVLGYRMSGKLTDADYKAVLSQMEVAVKAEGKISLLWLMEDFHGWELRAAWDDLRAWWTYRGRIDRMAMVGEKGWEEWMAKLAEVLHLADVKYFDHAKLQEAWDWARG